MLAIIIYSSGFLIVSTLIMIELEGGAINNVYLNDQGNVIKHFNGRNASFDLSAVGKAPEHRQRREIIALRHFSPHLAPSLLGVSEDHIVQEYVHGTDLESRARGGEDIFEEAGTILRRIHTPVKRHPSYLKDSFFSMVDRTYPKAKPILDKEGISPDFDIDWGVIENEGTTRLHGDYWLGNVIKNGHGSRVIDWEFAGIGSPYEDFAIVELWIMREFQNPKHFWNGYGKMPDQHTIEQYLKLKCIEFLATTTVDAYNREKPDDFYHNKVDILKTL